MKRALVLQHVAHEGPGRLRATLDALNVEVEVRRLDRGEALPVELVPYDLVVVMGGPMGVADVDDPDHAYLRGELELLRSALAEDVPVLGFCLGAQLIAHALGARVYPNQLGEPPLKIREVGWGPLTLHHEADELGLLSGLHDAEVTLHWHGDTFDLPTGAEWLASTLHCRHQMFRHGRAIGIQFHPEIDEAGLEQLLDADAAYVRATLGRQGAERIRRDTKRFYARYRETGDRLLQNVVRALLGVMTH